MSRSLWTAAFVPGASAASAVIWQSLGLVKWKRCLLGSSAWLEPFP